MNVYCASVPLPATILRSLWGNRFPPSIHFILLVVPLLLLLLLTAAVVLPLFLLLPVLLTGLQQPQGKGGSVGRGEEKQ